MEEQIVYTALEKLHHIPGIRSHWEQKGVLDGLLNLTIDGKQYFFTVKVQTEPRAYQLPLIEAYHQRYENFLLIAGHLFPKIKEQLQQNGIAYLEANGNIFLHKDGLFLLVDTHSTFQLNKKNSNRAFTKTGLKVVFYLLQHQDAIHLTQRELARKTHVGLGTIPQVIKGLKKTGYLIALNNKTYEWENRMSLLERWIAEYATTLKPKLQKERYTFKNDWRNIPFDTAKTVWGGEPAADLLTNHLRPEKFLIYTQESRMELIKNYRLIPDKNGEIEVLDMFWPKNEYVTAPPLLVYADLRLEGGKRNKETAEKIYDEYIQPNL